MLDRKLPKGKWYTFALERVKDLVEHRDYLNTKDSYIFRRAINDLDREIKNWITIFTDRESIAPDDRPLVAEGLKLLVKQGGSMWEKNDIEQITSIADLVGVNIKNN